MFNKEFYEKTYLKKFNTFEEAYYDWANSGGLLGKPLYDEQLKFFYNSQLGQDQYVINNIFNRKKFGVFLEFGACDGMFLSNTYVLEKYFDWSGLCVEPHPDYYSQLVNNRKCNKSNKLIDSHTGLDVEFSMQENLEVSGIKKYKTNHFYNDRVINLKTISLNDILEEYKDIDVIDYLSIDTEGSELKILSTFNFDKYKINYISIEHGNNIAYKNEIYEFLISKNFSLHRDIFWDSEFINNNFKG